MKLFRIRSEVMQALDAYSREAFQERMVLTMHERHGAECDALGAERVREAVLEGIERAVSDGIFDAGDIETFLHQLFTRGFSFDLESPWAKRILTDARLTGRVKIGLIAGMAD